MVGGSGGCAHHAGGVKEETGGGEWERALLGGENGEGGLRVDGDGDRDSTLRSGEWSRDPGLDLDGWRSSRRVFSVCARCS